MAPAALRALPMRTFWFMCDCIDRIAALEDRRSLLVAGSAQSSEGYEELHNRLVIEAGDIVKIEAIGPAAEELDRDGLDELRHWHLGAS